MKKDIIIETVQELGAKITEKQIELFARRLLPEIKQYFSNEKVQAEYKKWQTTRNSNKTE